MGRLFAAALIASLPLLALAACHSGAPDRAYTPSTASPPNPLQAGGGGGGM